DGTRLASASADHTVRVWDMQTGQEIINLKGHSGGIHHVSFSHDGRRLASAGDGTVRVWDAQIGENPITIKRQPDPLVGISFSPDGRRLASACSSVDPGISKKVLPEIGEGQIRVWDTQTGEMAAILGGHKGGASSVSFSPDGTRIASGSLDGLVR